MAAMQAWRSVIAALEAALDPDPVEALAAGTPHQEAGVDSGVQVWPLALLRRGRSTRSGPVLDLELQIGVRARGERSLDLLEAAFVALERRSLQVEPMPELTGLGLRVRVPVAVPLTEPEAPVVEQAQFDVGLVRPVSGTVVDAAGRGLSGALVRSAAGGPPALSQDDGTFSLLVPAAGGAELDVEISGERRSLPVERDGGTARLRWE